MQFKIEKVIMKTYFHWLSTIRKIPNFSQWRPYCFCSNIKIKQNFVCHPPDMCSLGINYVKKTWMTIPNFLSTLHEKCEILPPVYMLHCTHTAVSTGAHTFEKA